MWLIWLLTADEVGAGGKMSKVEVVEPGGKDRCLRSDGGKRMSCFGCD